MSGIELTKKGYQKFEDDHVNDGQPKEQVQSARDNVVQPPPKYDPLSIPANLAMAEDHFKATRIAKEVKKKFQNIDDQSGFPVLNTLVPVCSDLEELSFLSSGTPMYFQYLKFIVYILVVMLVTSSTYSLYSNYNGKSCLDPESLSDNYKKDLDIMASLCVKSLVSELSLSNAKDNGFVLEKQEIYNMFTAALLIFMIHYLSKSQKETAVRLDVQAITAADFTIQIKNFPRNFDSDNVDFDEEIKKFITEHGLSGRKVNVQDVNVCYDLRVKNEKMKEIKTLVAQREILLAEKEAGKADEKELEKLDQVEEKYAQLRKEVEEISNKFKEGKSVKEFFSGEAYVTVETQQEVQELVKHWNLSFFKRISEVFKAESEYKYKGELIIIKQAAEPSDVIWENSGIPAYQLFFRRLLSYVTIFASVVFFAIVIMISSGIKKQLIDDFQKQAMTSEHPNLFKTEAMIVSSIVSGFIVIINYIFKAIISFFSKFSKYESSTEYLQTYATALAWAQFLNTAIVSAVINAFTNNLWGPSGLVITAFQVQLFDILLGWGISFFDFGSFWGYCQRRKYRNQVARGEHILRTQEELNAAFEYPKYDFATKYAFYIKLLLSASFYASLSPLMVALTIVGISLGYWFEKYIFLRKRSRGISYGSELPLHLGDFLKYCVVFFALGNLFFHSYVKGYDLMDAVITLVTLGFALFNAILPTDTVIEHFFPRPQETVTDETYSAKKKFLVEDYRRFNPAFKEEAIAEFTRQREWKSQKFLQQQQQQDNIEVIKKENPDGAAKGGDLENGKPVNGLNIN